MTATRRAKYTLDEHERAAILDDIAGLSGGRPSRGSLTFVGQVDEHVAGDSWEDIYFRPWGTLALNHSSVRHYRNAETIDRISKTMD